MKKVLIIGGAGFIGYHLSKKFLKKKYKVFVLDNLSRKHTDIEIKDLRKNKNYNFIKGDILNFNNLKKKLNNDYSFIVNLAAIVGVDNVINNSYDVMYKNALINHFALQIAKKQKRLKKFIFFSTSEIYAGSLKNNLIKFPTKENNLISLVEFKNKRQTYMISKIYGEMMCFQSQLPILIIRPHNFFGPRMGKSHVIPELLSKLNNKKKKFILKNGHHQRTFCYIDDAVEIIFFLIVNKNKNTVYNVGQQKPVITILELAKKINKLFFENKNIKTEKKIFDHSPIKRCPDITLIKKEIKKMPNTSLNTALNKTFLWYKKYL